MIYSSQNNLAGTVPISLHESVIVVLDISISFLLHRYVCIRSCLASFPCLSALPWESYHSCSGLVARPPIYLPAYHWAEWNGMGHMLPPRSQSAALVERYSLSYTLYSPVLLDLQNYIPLPFFLSVCMWRMARLVTTTHVDLVRIYVCTPTYYESFIVYVLNYLCLGGFWDIFISNKREIALCSLAPINQPTKLNHTTDCSHNPWSCGDMTDGCAYDMRGYSAVLEARQNWPPHPLKQIHPSLLPNPHESCVTLVTVAVPNGVVNEEKIGSLFIHGRSYEV